MHCVQKLMFKKRCNADASRFPGRSNVFVDLLEGGGEDRGNTHESVEMGYIICWTESCRLVSFDHFFSCVKRFFQVGEIEFFHRRGMIICPGIGARPPLEMIQIREMGITSFGFHAAAGRPCFLLSHHPRFISSLPMKEVDNLFKNISGFTSGFSVFWIDLVKFPGILKSRIWPKFINFTQILGNRKQHNFQTP